MEGISQRGRSAFKVNRGGAHDDLVGTAILVGRAVHIKMSGDGIEGVMTMKRQYVWGNAYRRSGVDRLGV
jgi:hypothetical protein